MPITQSFAVELLAGETLKVAGPGVVEFSGAEIVRTKLGTVAGAKGVAMGTKGVAMGTKGAAMGAGTQVQVGAGTGQAIINTGLNQGTAVTSATTVASKTSAASTIWNGKGLSLGLGLGLGAWGPMILVSAVTFGGYVYWKKKQSARIWPF